MNWSEYFVNMADVVRQKSKDPSSKIGALIVGTDHEIISSGFNGFPRGIREVSLDQSELLDRWERPIKYQYVCHAERNAIYNAARVGHRLKGCSLYLVGFGPPCVPCTECTKAVIQSGITAVYGYAFKPAPDNWKDDLDFSLALLREAGVDFYEIDEQGKLLMDDVGVGLGKK